jgi:glycosyltransferase involved in cell wall biosynthesis
MIKKTVKNFQKATLEFFYKNEILATLWAKKFIKDDIHHATKSRQFFQKFKDVYPNLALQVGKVAIDYTFDPTFNSVYANRLEKIGKKEEANQVREKLRDIDIVKPNIGDTDKLFKVLSARGDSCSAEGWVNFLVLRDKECLSHLGRKYFIYFKDINKEASYKFGLKYIVSSPQDEKFSTVYLNRVSKTLSIDSLISLLNTLNKSHPCDLYKLKLHENIAKKKVIDIQNSSNILQEIDSIITSDSADKLIIIKQIFTHSQSTQVKIKCAEHLLRHPENIDNALFKKLSDYYLSRGSITSALGIAREHGDESWTKKKSFLSSFYQLYLDGYKYSLGQAPLYKKPSKKNEGILYLLHNRLPYNSGGYATRAHGLLTSIKEKWNISGVSRLGYPQDLKGQDGVEYVPYHNIDNITYYSLPSSGNGYGEIPMSDYIDEYSKELLALCNKEKPRIIHAASNYMNGLAANNVAKRLGIKSVYEVRGLWEITRISREPEWNNTEHYSMISRLEAQAAKDADAVFTLTNALKNELINRGVAAEKIHLLPNGVDSSRFLPKERNDELALKVGVKNKVVIGFLGSVVQYEGVEYIIQAASILKKKGIHNFAVLIVGDGAVLDNVKAITSELHMDEYVIFTGRVPHDEIEDYYSIVDICPLPRKGLPVCEMVSPLKPFEAMAMGKVVVSSDVAALAEIIDDGVTGLLHKKDDPEDLANKIRLLIEDHDLRERLGKSAREWVVAERDWKVIAKRVDTVYRNLLGQ